MKTRASIIVPLLLITVLFSPVVEAHPLSGQGNGWLTGLLHPLAGIDHLLAALAVGVIASRLNGRLILLPPLFFVAAMGLAVVIGPLGLPLAGYEFGIVLSLLLMGGMLALSLPFRLDIGLPLLLVLAFCHGVAHGAETLVTAGGFAYIAGLLLTTAMLHLTGLFLGRRLGQALLRLGGGAIAATGLALTFV